MAPRILILAAAVVAAALAAPPRLIVLTDIGGDPDDEQSMIRLMVHSSEFEIEGLIASASGTPGELKKHTTRPDLIRRIVEAYGKVQPNLLLHQPSFPPAARLMAVIKAGSSQRGEAAIGRGRETEGSQQIIEAVDRKDPRPVNIAVWGGPTELAQALWTVRATRSAAALQRFVSKLRVFAIGHQDDSGPWILREFPNLFYILASADSADVLGRPYKGKDRRASSYRGMYLGGDESLTSREWIDRHVRTGHGPLGELYPVKTWTAPNPHGTMKEGDTPSWFYFLPNGVGDPEHPEWGSFGGRFVLTGQTKHYGDAVDTVDGVTDARAGVWRWRPAFQSEFAARMDWCVLPRDKANHPPRPHLSGARSEARSGATIRLNASGSKDPDGDALTYRWWFYQDASTYEGDLHLESDGAEVRFRVPEVSAPQTVHIMLEVKDGGEPALTAFRRAVIRLLPR